MTKESQLFNIWDRGIGLIVFLIALATYWLSLEPTVSYWDCGEYIAQADRLEIGHAPGNPIFILAGRFFANFAPTQMHVALMINAMSGLFSALTILFLYWSITHISKKFLPTTQINNRSNWLIVFGAGITGALAYAWSDTFWFSAVEAEVYAFSSFCTAIVFWLILKWEENADEPHSDRFLLLIAYLIGISIAVHLLNLLCIPAIALVFAYKKYPKLRIWGTAITLLISFIIIALILFGLIPGFVKVAQLFELICVNYLHCDFNSGAIAYSATFMCTTIWAIIELHNSKSTTRIIASTMLMLLICGILFIGNNIFIWILLICVTTSFLVITAYKRRLPVRIINNIVWSIFVIFIGYSSYALIIIRSDANPPMNENSPDNLFALSSYLNRDQYSKNPLIYGATPYARQMKIEHVDINETTGKEYYSYSGIHKEKGARKYAKGLNGITPVYRSGFVTHEDSIINQELAKRTDDFYFFRDYDYKITTTPELNMLFPRIFSASSTHLSSYESWAGMTTSTMDSIEVSIAIDSEGNHVGRYDNQTGNRIYERLPKPTVWQNLRYFFSYQVGYMYFRYFLWNFSGRQNDRHSQGQADTGNFITGIPVIDDAMLGDQSKLPLELGSENKGHNVYFMLPLLLGILGIVWLMNQEKTGRRYSLIIFLLFFMTGIAIVIYLNQTPNEPRERDYAFAGSFYAWAVLIGLGVPAIYHFVLSIIKRISRKRAVSNSIVAASVAITSFAIPLQMLSQTYDDHNRCGRTAARDYAINILESLEQNAILFTNGDNFTFPLWYVQEVEGVRRDVRVVNLAYLSTDWYLMQLMIPAYESEPLPLTATPEKIAMKRCSIVHIGNINQTPTDAITAFKHLYNQKNKAALQLGYPILKIPTHKSSAIDKNLISKDEYCIIEDSIILNIHDMIPKNRRYIRQDELAIVDIIATNANNQWSRPIYWLKDVGISGFYGLKPYFKQVGMVYQLTPHRRHTPPCDTEKVYDLAMNKFLWGGADKSYNEHIPYFDETAGDVLGRFRRTLIATANHLITTADADSSMTENYQKALLLLRKIEKSLPQHVWPFETFYEEYITSNEAAEIAKAYHNLSIRLANDSLNTHAINIIKQEIINDAAFLSYQNALPKNMRGFISVSSKLTIQGFYALIYTYEKIGGNMQQLILMPELKNFNLEQIKNIWLRYSIRQTLTRDARPTTRLARLHKNEYNKQPYEAIIMDSTIYSRITDYINAGGAIEDLKNIAEFSEFDFVRAARLYYEYTGKTKDDSIH